MIGLVGVATQLTGSLLVLLLFVLLQRRARRGYFGWWTAGWAFVMVAILAVAVLYVLLTPGGPYGVDPRHPALDLLYGGYQLAKLCGIGCMLAGAAAYADRPLSSLHLRAIGAIFVVVALLSVLFLPGMRAFVAWQTSFAVPVFATSAVLLLRLPPGRRSLGSMATGLTFAAGAVLWTAYAWAFRAAPSMAREVPGSVAGMIVQFNPFLDFLLTVFLSFGMVVLLMEDAKREVEEAKRQVDAAHARLAEAHAQLRRAATYDPLTGCLNRQGFLQQQAVAGRALQAGTVVVVDMDNLKEVNDRHGHPAGDAMLRHLACVLQQAAPEGALLFRWGGDEFLILLPDMPPAAAEELFRHAIRSAPAVELPGAQATCTMEASVGAARFTGPDALEGALRRADRGMYDHKQWRKRRTGDQKAILS